MALGHLAGRALLILLVIFWPSRGYAQRGQDAGLFGVVRDQSGAVLVAATISVSSPQLIGGSQVAASDLQGIYRFPFLPAGQYDIVAEQTDFKTSRRAGVTLLPGLTFAVDFTLEVAATIETVVVDGPTPIVDVRTSSVPLAIERQLLENLPLSQSAADAVNLAPGVVRDIGFGGSQRSNPQTLDGISGNEPGWGTPVVNPNLNWIDELQIVSLGADAQYGEYTGVRENAITRSGSNRFSGLANFWATRPDWVGNNRGSLTPQLRQRFTPAEIIERWTVDGQAGGPLVKDRLWFFTGGEVYRDVNRPASFAEVPRTSNEPRFDAHEQNFMQKMTAAFSPAIRAEGYYVRATADVDGANAGLLVRPDALTISNRRETMWNGRLLWTVRSRAFIEVQHGGHSATSYYGPAGDRRFGPPGHFDTLTGVSSENATYYSDQLSRPILTGAHVTLFATRANGHSHEIRSGFEHEHAKLFDERGYVGGRAFYDFDGQPDTVSIAPPEIYRPRSQPLHDVRAGFLERNGPSDAESRHPCRFLRRRGSRPRTCLLGPFDFTAHRRCVGRDRGPSHRRAGTLRPLPR